METINLNADYLVVFKSKDHSEYIPKESIFFANEIHDNCQNFNGYNWSFDLYFVNESNKSIQRFYNLPMLFHFGLRDTLFPIKINELLQNGYAMEQMHLKQGSSYFFESRQKDSYLIENGKIISINLVHRDYSDFGISDVLG